MTPGGQRLPTLLTLEARPMPVLPQGSHPLSCRGTDRPRETGHTHKLTPTGSRRLCQGPPTGPRGPPGGSAAPVPPGWGTSSPQTVPPNEREWALVLGVPRGLGWGWERRRWGSRAGPGRAPGLSSPPPLHRRPQCWGGRDLPLPPAPPPPLGPGARGGRRRPGLRRPGRGFPRLFLLNDGRSGPKPVFLPIRRGPRLGSAREGAR